MKYSKKVLNYMLIILMLFVIGVLIVFWHTGSEPSTLVASVFAFCGVEGGLMAWIKTTKVRKGENKNE